MKLYALFDQKSDSFSAFQVAKSDAVVSRDFAQAVLEPKSMLGKYPEDFSLVCLAIVHDEIMDGPQVECLKCPETVLAAKQVLDLQPKEC